MAVRAASSGAIGIMDFASAQIGLAGRWKREEHLLEHLLEGLRGRHGHDDRRS